MDEKETLQRRIFVPAAKRAAVLLWGEDGLKQIAALVEGETRAEFFRDEGADRESAPGAARSTREAESAPDEWVASRHVIDWCFGAFEGPCRRDRNKMAEYVDRTYDFSFGVVRRLVLEQADPASVVPRIPDFWKQDYTDGGEIEAELDPSGKGCVLRITNSPYVETPHARAGMAEIFRYGFAQTRAREVTQSHALERQAGTTRAEGKQALVIRLRWQ